MIPVAYLRLVRADHAPPRPPQMRRWQTFDTAPVMSGPLYLQWLSSFDAMRVRVERPPFPDAPIYSVYLAGPNQLLLIAPQIDADALTIAREWDHALERPRDGEQTEETREPVVVVFGLSAGRFAGYQRGGQVRESGTDLFRCRRCRQWWFAFAWDSWACANCRHYDGDAGFDCQFSDRVPRVYWGEDGYRYGA